MRLLKKFKRAGIGLAELTGELSIKIEIGAGLVVLLLAWKLAVSRWEWLWLIGACAGVIILEGLNTVLERIIDLAEPRYHEAVRQIKDALAGLVFLAAFGAVIVGLVIFLPYLLNK